MYTLYCQEGTRATAAQMTLAEAGVPHRLQRIDITANEHRSRDFLAINPRGTIPALTDESGTLACETVAIMLYLADRHSLEELAPTVQDRQRAALLDWLLYHAGEVQVPVKRSFYPHRYALRDDDTEGVREHANREFTHHWRIVERHLRDNGPYHLGERFSLVDIYLLVTACYSMELAEGDFPAIAECMRLTGARERIAPILERHRAALGQIIVENLPV